MKHAAKEIISFDREKKIILVQFDKEQRSIDLVPLFKNHTALRGLAIVPVIEDGDLMVGPIRITGATLYHMGAWVG